MKRFFIAVGALAAAFTATTWWALESSGVAVVETRKANGTVHTTHVWYAEADGKLWLEAGSPESGWFRDVQQTPALSFVAEGRSARYVARPVTEPLGHERIRSLMREKYGLRDRWVGLLVDTSRSVMIELVPEER
jgi:hypothetical protein